MPLDQDINLEDASPLQSEVLGSDHVFGLRNGGNARWSVEQVAAFARAGLEATALTPAAALALATATAAAPAPRLVPGTLYILTPRLDPQGQPLPDVRIRAASETQLEPQGLLMQEPPMEVSYDLATDTTSPVRFYLSPLLPDVAAGDSSAKAANTKYVQREIAAFATANNLIRLNSDCYYTSITGQLLGFSDLGAAIASLDAETRQYRGGLNKSATAILYLNRYSGFNAPAGAAAVPPTTRFLLVGTGVDPVGVNNYDYTGLRVVGATRVNFFGGPLYLHANGVTPLQGGSVANLVFQAATTPELTITDCLVEQWSNPGGTATPCTVTLTGRSRVPAEAPVGITVIDNTTVSRPLAANGGTAITENTPGFFTATSDAAKNFFTAGSLSLHEALEKVPNAGITGYQLIPAGHWAAGDPPQDLVTVNAALEYLHGRTSGGGTGGTGSTKPVVILLLGNSLYAYGFDNSGNRLIPKAVNMSTGPTANSVASYVQARLARPTGQEAVVTLAYAGQGPAQWNTQAYDGNVSADYGQDLRDFLAAYPPTQYDIRCHLHFWENVPGTRTEAQGTQDYATMFNLLNQAGITRISQGPPVYRTDQYATPIEASKTYAGELQNFVAAYAAPATQSQYGYYWVPGTVTPELASTDYPSSTYCVGDQVHYSQLGNQREARNVVAGTLHYGGTLSYTAEGAAAPGSTSTSTTPDVVMKNMQNTTVSGRRATGNAGIAQFSGIANSTMKLTGTGTLRAVIQPVNTGILVGIASVRSTTNSPNYYAELQAAEYVDGGNNQDNYSGGTRKYQGQGPRVETIVDFVLTQDASNANQYACQININNAAHGPAFSIPKAQYFLSTALSGGEFVDCYYISGPLTASGY